jgi:hypothetical protein
VRLGLTNAEIGARLGVSPDAVKYHVSNMLGKLGLESRKELAAWQPTPAKPAGRRWALLPLGWLRLPARSGARWLAFAGVAGLLGVIAVVVVLTTLDGDEEPAASGLPTETATETETPIATPPTPAGVTATATATEPPASTLRIRAPFEFPDDLVLYVEEGCSQCDGPATAVGRTYRAADGSLATDKLLEAAAAAPPGPILTGFGIGTNGHPMAATLCTTEDTCGGLGWAVGNPQTTLLWSEDGGISWAEIARLDGGFAVLGIVEEPPLELPGPQALLVRYATESTPLGFVLAPSMTELQPPVPDAFPYVLNTGQLVWSTDGSRTFHYDGSELTMARRASKPFLPVSFEIISANGQPHTHCRSATGL